MERKASDSLTVIYNKFGDNLKDQLKDRNKQAVQDLLVRTPTSFDFEGAAIRAKNLEKVISEVMAEMNQNFGGWAKRLRDVGLTVPTIKDLIGDTSSPEVSVKPTVEVIKVPVSNKADEYAKRINQEINPKLPDETLIDGLYYWNKNSIRGGDKEKFNAEITPLEWIDWMNKQNPMIKGFIKQNLGRAKGSISSAEGNNFNDHLHGIKTLGQLRLIVSGNPGAFGESCVRTTLFLEQAFKKLDDETKGEIPAWGLSEIDWQLQEYREAIKAAHTTTDLKGVADLEDGESITQLRNNLRDAAWTLNRGVKWLSAPGERQIQYKVLIPDLPADLPEGTLYKLSRAFKQSKFPPSDVILDAQTLELDFKGDGDIPDTRTASGLFRDFGRYRSKGHTITVSDILSREVDLRGLFGFDVRNFGELGFQYLLFALAKKGVIPQA